MELKRMDMCRVVHEGFFRHVMQLVRCKDCGVLVNRNSRTSHFGDEGGIWQHLFWVVWNHLILRKKSGGASMERMDEFLIANGVDDN